jgi:hypothetical protein
MTRGGLQADAVAKAAPATSGAKALRVKPTFRSIVLIAAQSAPLECELVSFYVKLVELFMVRDGQTAAF